MRFANAKEIVAYVKDLSTTESTVNDSLGSTRDITKKTKKQTRSKARKTQKELQRTRFVFLRPSKRSKAYHDYFNPDPAVENRLMGLTNKVDPETIRISIFHVSDLQIRTSSSMKGKSKLPELLTSCQSPMDEVLREAAQLDDSQTQEASQNVLMLAIARQTKAPLKRKVRNDTDKPTKKIKISIGTAVDLCD
ncbi:hypothetical protein BKA83DRAFT_4121790 [Pisolithus microcarpus]|nr:hypothetical protein BKA83DRAFT_4121790 [Pisolithus microcarpus]